MTTQDWINEQKVQAVQDRKDGKNYWITDNLYTEADLIELLEAFALYNVVGQNKQLQGFFDFYKQKFGGGFNTDVLEITLKQYKDTL